jgi:8-oxo-dGTP diphosphatase
MMNTSSALKRSDPCPHCGRYDNRGVTIDAVIIRGSKVLLIKRGVEPDKGYWGTPGGYVDWDESVEDTVKREVKEETNLDVTSLKLVGLYSKPSRHPKQAINALFLVKAKGKAKHGDDTLDARWFSTSKLPNKMALDHRQLIKDTLRQAKNNC